MSILCTYSKRSITRFQERKPTSSLTIFIAIFAIWFSTSALLGNTQNITVNISNVKAKAGKIVIGLYNSPATWLSTDKQFRVLTIPADKSEIIANFIGLPHGDYAVSMYQDENSNGICDKSFFGIPIEKIGFSNNIVPTFFKPTFKECMIKAPRTIGVKLVLL